MGVDVSFQELLDTIETCVATNFYKHHQPSDRTFKIGGPPGPGEMVQLKL